MPMRALLVLSVVLSLSACAHDPAGAQDAAASTPPAAGSTPETPVDPMPADCNAAAAQSYVGQAASDANLDAVRGATGAKNVRVIKPGDAVTMDFRSDRLNIELDAQGRIARIGCG
ncbi:I78 family peptidase inhibitor [Luteimonas aquatica]|uniref:I78 family peptidase inhibitor n=1 Tax=Luteimonas aquatica TaxID=450364 RepID=UPI001F57F2FC|nr:I78 family peptidase inhibitor [Luteimonas aquatica]